MDVTSLLNTSSAAAAQRASQQLHQQQQQRRDSIDQTPTPSATGGTTASSTAVPTPSPDRTPSRRTSSGSRSPIRNRTPWDAGGYSLPLTLDTKSIIQTPVVATARPSFYGESPIEGLGIAAGLGMGGGGLNLTSASPNSPRHKFSDSRSSLSSYTSSSNNSVSHSRISSLSTVSEFQPLSTSSVPGAVAAAAAVVAFTNSEFQPLANLLTDITLDPRMPSHQAALEAGGAVSAKDCPTLGFQPPSPTTDHAANNNSVRSQSNSRESSAVDTDAPLTESIGRRPGSPSDAVMIPRGQNGPSTADSPTNLSQDELNLLSPETSPNRAHKRSVSAPDFAAIASNDRRGGFVDDSSDPSQALTSSNRVDSLADLSPVLAEEPDAFLNDPVVKCMYIDNCDTNSQPRKAISHIFGRNKLCTRSIPDHVWVHFCRKHYQRSRYRNAQEYAKTQCDLVAKQVFRVQAWSDRNAREGKPGVVRNWSLSIRKREQKRLDDKKRKYRDDDDDDDDDDGNTDNRALASGTAVPQWLLNKCGTGYTTRQINEIVDELRLQMEAGNLSQIPDIEILPNVITDASDENKSKPYPKRKTSANTHHKRAQSAGVGPPRPLLGDYSSMNATRRFTNVQPAPGGYWPSPEDPYANTPGMLPLQKRPRMGSEQEDLFGNRLPSMPPRNTDRTVPNMRRMTVGMGMGHHSLSQPHRPAFQDIRENHTEDRFYDDRQANPLTTTANPYVFGAGATMPGHGPLPAPTPQRHSSTPTAEQLETNNQPSTHAYQRPTHQRSFSDFSTIYQGSSQMGGYRPSSSGYPGNATGGGNTPNGYTIAGNNYTAVSTQPYDTGSGTPGGYSMADYMRPETTATAWGTPGAGNDVQGPPGYYDDIPTNAGRTGQSPYPTGPPPFYGTATPSGPPAGGAAKHMRHQSQPVMPPRGSMYRSYSNSSPGANGSNHYSFTVNGPSYTVQGYEQTPPPMTTGAGGYHMRNQSYSNTMPRLDEMIDPARDGRYGQR